MGYNSRYWDDKENRGRVALQHTKEVSQRYSAEIKRAVAKSVVYTDKVDRNKTIETMAEPIIEVVDLDSVSAVFNCYDGHSCILNFASYRHPGGGFIKGSKAQEECLCHASFLYNVLRQFDSYYAYNELHLNDSLYTNRAIYTPNVIFERENDAQVIDVLTCAAPNYSAYVRVDSDGSKQNYDALKSRIEFIRDIVEQNNVDTLIAGAFGCGVFRQDAKIVANLFKEIFSVTSINKIIYAIPASIDEKNYNEFVKVFSV